MGNIEEDGYRSSGDESLTAVSPPQRRQKSYPQHQQQELPLESRRPTLNNRLIPPQDDTPFENSTTSIPPKNKHPPLRPSLKNRIIPIDDQTPFENDGLAEKLPKTLNSRGSEKDQTSFTSVTSHDNIKDGAVSGSQKSLKRDILQEVMKDNIELMYEIVMRIREDKEYAKSIYRNCPRLQNLLDQHPDLRPLFEDPNLIRINFEKVYRDAGGVFPEDEVKPNRFQKVISCVVNHPLFRVLKVLLFIKKIFSCIAGGGVGLIKGCCTALFWTPEAPAGPPGPSTNTNTSLDPDSQDGTDVVGNTTDPNLANKIALYRAADHMSDPKVQANMTELLRNDPDLLDDAIENDPELRALRDSNPLCAELMSDPETMKILTDPDNLRALADAPELIQQDFADPDWTPPPLEAPADVVVEDEPTDSYFIDTGDNTHSGNTNTPGNEGEAENTDMGDGTGAILEDFELGDTNASGPQDNDGGGNIDAGDEQIEDTNALEDFELGDNNNTPNSGEVMRDANGEDLENDDVANTYEDGNALEDFELGDHFVQPLDQNGSTDVNGAVTESQEGNIDSIDDGGDTYMDGNALEDFELGEVNTSSPNHNLNLNVEQDMLHDANVDNGDAYEEDANALEDFEIGESDAQNGTNARVDETMSPQDDANNALLEDFELGETNNSVNATPSATDGVTSTTNLELESTPATGDSDTSHGIVSGARQQERGKEREEGVPRSGEAAGYGVMIGQIAHGLTEVFVSEVVGMGFDKITGGIAENDIPNSTLGNIADNAEYAEEAVEAAENTAAANREADTGKGSRDVAIANSTNPSQRQGDAARSESGDAVGDDSTTQSPVRKMGMVGRIASTFKTTVKEAVASVLVGDDFGEMLVEAQEERRQKQLAEKAAAQSKVNDTVEGGTVESNTPQGEFSNALGPTQVPHN